MIYWTTIQKFIPQERIKLIIKLMKSDRKHLWCYNRFLFQINVVLLKFL